MKNLELNQTPSPTDEETFAKFGLDHTNQIPHPCGDIPAGFVGITENGNSMEMIWGLRKGSHYPPEQHSHGHILTIKHGSGIISVNGKEQPYSPGSIFDVAGNIPHGFIDVKETTIVNQKQPAN
jgi:quercetin dioxygenase-like cupin family protein